ncbi:aminoacylase-1A-like protein [Syncephalis fuscata]|nr:aminoacylase-1A-like protein [Syncephalis fuscata]
MKLGATILTIVASHITLIPAAKSDADQSASDAMAVKNFQDYIRIRTEQPNPDYKSAMTFLKQLADEINLSFKTVEPVANKPVAILTWTGADASLPSIMLNSHTDVVPVFKDQWTHDPFAAERVRQDNGDYKIFGHEELGGATGMAVFCKTKEFNDLNIGFSLDEGQASPSSNYILYYDERVGWPFTVKARGSTGHGSQFIQNTASQKLMNAINDFLVYRHEQEELLKTGSHNGKPLTLGDVTTINLTMLKGGVQSNVVPAEMEAVFDFRITPHTDFEKLSQWLDSVAAKNNVTLIFKDDIRAISTKPPTGTDRWQRIIEKTCKDLNITVNPEIFPAATDARFLRKLGLPAFGISPIRNTPILLHSDDEFMYESVYLEGIVFYKNLIKNLAN